MGMAIASWPARVLGCDLEAVGPEDVVEPCESKAEQKVRSGATVASGAGENHVGHKDRTSPSSLSGSSAFRVKGPWDPITTPAEDCDVETFLSGSSDEEDCPVTELLPMDQPEETMPVDEEEPVALSEMASGTSESDVGHMERTSPSSPSGRWAFHLKRPRPRTSQHVEDCVAEIFLSGSSDEEDCPVTEVLPMDQAEETVPVAEERPGPVSEMASGTSESDCDGESFLSGSPDQEDCPDLPVIIVEHYFEYVEESKEQINSLHVISLFFCDALPEGPGLIKADEVLGSSMSVKSLQP
ncbi:Protein Vac14 [Manis pentadactyla]|nr:Protein Vac14 [Manis pentadactyla]